MVQERRLTASNERLKRRRRVILTRVGEEHGMNRAILTTILNSFSASLFCMKWKRKKSIEGSTVCEMEHVKNGGETRRKQEGSEKKRNWKER